MTETLCTTIPSDLIGTERGDALVAEYSQLTRELYECDGKRVTRIEVAANHALGIALAEITIADEYTPEPLQFGDENELPAVEGEEGA